MAAMQDAIKRDLNPLFKIHDLVAHRRAAAHRVEQSDAPRLCATAITARP